MATAPYASSLFLASSPISTAPRNRAGPCPPSAQPSLRLRPRPSPAAAAAVQAEHQPALTAAPKPPALPFRVGHGFDLHRLEPDLPLIIGGINIPHDRGCEAHSDGTRSCGRHCPLWFLRGPVSDLAFGNFVSSPRAGDVLLHCVVDAILGALGLPDIGQIFPDSDPRWKGADSSVFMREAVSFSSF
jgi:2-C-methyl-D-erythritol 2,4-cyclodiphosphate synthase